MGAPLNDAFIAVIWNQTCLISKVCLYNLTLNIRSASFQNWVLYTKSFGLRPCSCCDMKNKKGTFINRLVVKLLLSGTLLLFSDILPNSDVRLAWKMLERGRKGDLCSVTCLATKAYKSSWNLVNLQDLWLMGKYANSTAKWYHTTLASVSYITSLKLSGCLWDNLLQHVRWKQSLWPLDWASFQTSWKWSLTSLQKSWAEPPIHTFSQNSGKDLKNWIHRHQKLWKFCHEIEFHRTL